MVHDGLELDGGQFPEPALPSSAVVAGFDPVHDRQAEAKAVRAQRPGRYYLVRTALPPPWIGATIKRYSPPYWDTSVLTAPGREPRQPSVNVREGGP